MFSFHLKLPCFLLVVDPSGAQKKVLEVASDLGLTVSVAVAHEVHFETGASNLLWKPLLFHPGRYSLCLKYLALSEAMITLSNPCI